MNDINLNAILILGLFFIFILIFHDKDTEGIKIIGLIIENLIIAIFSYKRGEKAGQKD